MLQPAHFEQSVCHTAQGDRLATFGTICEPGVNFNPEVAADPDGAASLEVTPGGGMTVDVDAGQAYVLGTPQSSRGMYSVVNLTPTTLPVDPADPADPRIDLVIAEVRDSEYGEAAPGSSDWTLRVVPGVADPSPDPPAAPDSSIVLAEVLVQAATSSIGAADINDLRTGYRLCSQNVPPPLLFATSGTFDRRDHPWARVAVVTAVGGGGGGGGVGVGGYNVGGGGGAGGWSQSTIVLASTPNPNVPVTVGAGGSGGGGNTAGQPGGSSSFGALVVALGGGGGQSASPVGSSRRGDGGIGAAAGTGDVVKAGANGSDGIVIDGAIELTIGGAGASSTDGGGGPAIVAGVTRSGGRGEGWGSGGSGAAKFDPASNAAGGSGRNGFVRVELFA